MEKRAELRAERWAFRRMWLGQSVSLAAAGPVNLLGLPFLPRSEIRRLRRMPSMALA